MAKLLQDKGVAVSSHPAIDIASTSPDRDIAGPLELGTDVDEPIFPRVDSGIIRVGAEGSGATAGIAAEDGFPPEPDFLTY